jgi:hypothetical protein
LEMQGLFLWACGQKVGLWDALSWRMLSFDSERRLAVSKQHKRSGAGQQVGVGAAGDFARSFWKPRGDVAVEFLCSTDQRAERRSSREIIDDLLARHGGPLCEGKLQLRVNHGNRFDLAHIRQSERPACKPFVQKPKSPRVSSGWRLGDDLLDLRLFDDLKKGGKNS